MSQRVRLTPAQMDDLSQLAYSLGAVGSKTRKEFAALVKKANPDRFTRSFSDVAMEEKFEERDRKLAEKEHQAEIDRLKAKQESARAELTKRYSEDHIKGIEAKMEQLGISDYSAGAVLYAHDNPDSDPTLRPPRREQRPGSTWEFPTMQGADGKDVPFKEFAADPKKYANDTAYRMIDQFRNGSLGSGFGR